jgi:hypothetical protein
LGRQEEVRIESTGKNMNMHKIYAIKCRKKWKGMVRKHESEAEINYSD